MTEAEWLAATDPQPLLEFLQGASERKRRLFACGCCRRAWDLLSDHRSRKAVEVSEDFADGRCVARQLAAARQAAQRAWLKIRTIWDGYVVSEPDPALYAATTPVFYAATAAHELTSRRSPEFVERTVADLQLVARHRLGRLADAERLEEARQSDLARCVFGSPGRPVTADPQWLTSTVVALAEGAYRDRAWDRLPGLADALQDAGCDCEELLGHCRSGGPHCRGCWAVDLLTGRG